MAQNDGIQNSNSLNNPEYSNRYNNANTFSLHKRVADTFRFGEVRPVLTLDTINGDRLDAQFRHELRSHTFSSPFLSSLKMHRTQIGVPKMAILPRLYDLLYMNPKIGDDIVQYPAVRPNVPFRSIMKILSSSLTAMSNRLSNALNHLSDLSGDELNTDAWKTLHCTECLLRVVENFVLKSGLLSSLGINFASRISTNGRFSKNPGSFLEFPVMYYLDSDNVRATVSRPSDWLDSKFTSYDEFVEYCITALMTDRVIASDYFILTSSIGTYSKPALEKLLSSFPSFLRFCRDLIYKNEDTSAAMPTLHPSVIAFYQSMCSIYAAVIDSMGFNQGALPAMDPDMHAHVITENADYLVDLYPVLAYQLSMVQYFTNDNVDVIHESQLFLRSMSSLYRSAYEDSPTGVSGGYGTPLVNWNGIQLECDVLSGYTIFNVFALSVVPQTSDYSTFLKCMIPSVNIDSVTSAFHYLANLFTIKNSLVYGDYFVGCRERPLGVDEENNVVVSIPQPLPSDPIEVSAIDVTRSIIWQKFLNFINRIHMTMKEYGASVFGRSPQAVPYQPFFIADEEFSIFGNETTNTADEQGNITTNLNTEQSKHLFSLLFNDDCIALTLCWFDMPRNYPNYTSRFRRHLNRFDDFQPFLQNVGDQQINVTELTSDISSDIETSGNLDKPFGYTGRYMEYKQEVNEARGGFAVNALPSWIPVYLNLFNSKNIDESFVRSYPWEFDRFYKQLTAYFTAYPILSLLCLYPMKS